MKDKEANALRKFRQAQGLTLKRLSELSGVPMRAIQKYEGGVYEISNMTLRYALMLCDALEIDPHTLLDD